jgi:Coenzyme PQQ synthesis protein D (PqqD)
MTAPEGSLGKTRNGALASSDRVVSETIDGEVVAIDLESGRYYSLEGPAARAWEAIQAGQDVEGIVDAVAAEASVGGDEARADVVAFLAELEAEGLLLDGNGDGPAPGSPAPGPGHVTLVLHRYTDMQDLIVLDPIHDVDETGWPNRRPE